MEDPLADLLLLLLSVAILVLALEVNSLKVRNKSDEKPLAASPAPPIKATEDHHKSLEDYYRWLQDQQKKTEETSLATRSAPASTAASTPASTPASTSPPSTPPVATAKLGRQGQPFSMEEHVRLMEKDE